MAIAIGIATASASALAIAIAIAIENHQQILLIVYRGYGYSAQTYNRAYEFQ